MGWLKEKSCKMHTIGPGRAASESLRGCRIVWAAFENICKHVFGKFGVFAKANHCPDGGGLEAGLANITVRRHGVSRVVTSHQPPGLLIAPTTHPRPEYHYPAPAVESVET